MSQVSSCPYFSRSRDFKGAFLYTYSHKGVELWRVEPKREVSDRSTRFSDIYVLRGYEVFPSPEKDGTHWTAAVFVHHYEYPSLLVVVDSTGKPRGEYWHSGHLDDLHTLDLDGDGIMEILTVGTTRATSQALVRIFDPRNVSGAEVLPSGHPNQLLGFEPGTEKATIFFARSRLNKDSRCL